MKKITKSNQNPLTALHRLEFILQHQSEQLLRSGVGVGLGQARIMEEIGATTCSQRELATRLYQTEANVSRQLQVMKRRGLVSVIRNKKDARQRDVSLTSKGNGTNRQAQKILKKQHDELAQILDFAESAALKGVVHKLAQSIS